MREVHTELRLEHKVLVEIHLSEHCREHLVLLVLERIVLKPFERVLTLSVPCSVINRSKRSVSLVRVPVRKHEA